MAQNSRIDSLERALASFGGDVLQKSDLLRDLSFEYKDVHPQKCKEYAEMALQLAQSAGCKWREGAAHNILGVYYYFTDQAYLAYVHYKQAEKLFRENGDPSDLKEIFFNLMQIFVFVHEADSATYYAHKLIDMAIEEDDLASEITARYALGQIRFRDRRGQEELDYYLNLFQKAAPLDDNIKYVVALCCGEAHIQLEQYHEGLTYFHQARRHFEICEEAGFLMEANLMLAEAHTKRSQVDSAERYIQKVLDSPNLYNDTKLRLLKNRSTLDSIKGDCWSSLASYKKYHHFADSIAKYRSANDMNMLISWNNMQLENRILQQEKKMHQTLIITLIVVLFLIFILIAQLAYNNRLKKKKTLELTELHRVKNKLFSVVAHDLRSPIGALMSMLKLVNENMLDTTTQTKLLKSISNRVDDTYGLLDNLLHWSKSQMQGIVPAPAYFDVLNVGSTVIQSLKGIATEKEINIINRLKQQQVYADKDMFVVVIRNLTMNALKYTYDGGEIVIDSVLSGEKLIISVKDNGTGMTKDIQDKLFKLEKTASKRGTNNESGTGLGLVLCAEFVKANGGRIWFESKPSQGSTFFFSLPVKK